MTSVHPMNGSNTATNLKFYLGEVKAEQLAITTSTQNALRMQSSPAIVQAEKLKKTKYAPLVHYATVQTIRKKRSHTPTMLPLVVSHTGEMGQGVWKLSESIVGKYADKIRRSNDNDGVPIARLKSVFRKNLKDALYTSLVRGWGGQLLSAGNIL